MSDHLTDVERRARWQEVELRAEIDRLRAENAELRERRWRDDLTFRDLAEANRARLPQFRNKHGDLAHSKADGSDWSPAQWLQAVVGELGEYANVRKKFERGDLSDEEFLREAADELADTITYLSILADQLGIDLGVAVADKFNRVSERVGSDVRLPLPPDPETP